MTSTPPVLALPTASAELAARLQQGLDEVDAMLRREVDHDDPFIAEASAHLASAGGKRFRPLLTLLAAELGSGVNREVVAAATGVELTHLASLYHDDVMDLADVRRGAPSANAKYGTSCSARRPRSSPTSVPRRSRSRRRHSSASVPARSATTGPARRAPTRSSTTWACWPTRPAS